MKKQTAVEWLAWKFATTDTEEFKDNFNSFLSEAKTMEKEQIEEAYGIGYTNCEVGIKYRKQYYNENFKSE